ncbi:MAG: thioesterase family protein [Anaerolineales bacterium]
MNSLRFFHPIEVRYGDLDPQGHVNNARYLTYCEQARIAYIRHLGLWTSGDFLEIGVILADAHIAFKRPILFGEAVRVGAGVTRLGNKSFEMRYVLENAAGDEVFAVAESVLVTFDYRTEQTISIPAAWRAAIAAFDGLG